MIIDMKQVNELRAMEMDRHVTGEALHAGGEDILNAITDLFVHALEATSTYITVHPGEVMRSASYDIAKDTVKFTHKWNPVSNEAELSINGASMVYQLPTKGTLTIDIMKPDFLKPMWYDSEYNLSEETIRIERATYTLYGWNDETRRWVYTSKEE